MRIVIFVFIACGITPTAGAGSEKPLTNTQAISGTWVLQQVSSRPELERLRTKIIAPALNTPHIRGFSLRVPWNAIDEDFSLLQDGLKIAREHRLAFSVRFMAGRHTPGHVFDRGCRFYLIKPRNAVSNSRTEKVPVPFLADGSPNKVFEEEYDKLVAPLAKWCRDRDVRLLHLAWYGQHWAELNHGREVRALSGYSYENWLRAHIRLLDIALKYAGEDLAVELPFSGYGPLTEAASEFADHVINKIGPSNQAFFCQANGWGPNGDWGAPNSKTEADFDKVWAKPICRGQQAIQPDDFDWPKLFEKLYQNKATYCEIYTPSLLQKRKALLADEIRKFAQASTNQGPLLPKK